MTSVGDLVFDIVFRGDTKTLSDVVSDIGKLPVRSAAAALSLNALFRSIGSVAKSSFEYATGMSIFSKNTGVATKDAQQLGRVLELIGGHAENAMSSISSLQEKMTRVRSGDAAAAAPFSALFAQTGIKFSVDDDVMTFMDKLQKVSGSIPAARRSILFRDLGLSDDVIAAMASPEWAQRSQMPYQTEDQIKQLMKEREEIKKVEQEWNSAMRSMMTQMLPIIESTAKWLKDTDALGKVIKGLSYSVDMIAKAFDAVKESLKTIAAVVRLVIVELGEMLGYMGKAAKFLGAEAAVKSFVNPWDAPKYVTEWISQDIHKGVSREAVASVSTSKTSNATNNTVTINVNGAKDSKDVAQEVEKRIKRVLGVAAASYSLRTT